jgi:hypothetical protein
MAPGLADFRPRLIHSEKCETPGGVQHPGWYADSRWEAPTFNRRELAQAYCAANPARPGTEWKIESEGFEHSENYSMGGGNYLKAGSRHASGWTVFSRSIGSDGDFDSSSVYYEDGLPAEKGL